MPRPEPAASPARYRIVFNATDPNPTDAAYGGGAGGYGRWVQVVLDAFDADDIDLVPCFQSARKSGRLYRLAFPYRLVRDVLRLVRAARGADGIHMTLQYRKATPREFLSMLAARLMGVPVIVDIRAGRYIQWYENASPLYRWMASYVVRAAAEVAVEGAVYVPFLREAHGIEATYCPMAVASEKIPAAVPQRCRQPPLKILFVGYCYDGKGVKELVSGAREAARRGADVALTLVGEEHEEFAAWMEHFEPGPLALERLGRRPHEEVLELMLAHDVFCMPTRHAGEGHPNVINEAMMTAMVIVVTRHGFLEDVLGEKCCYFVENDPSSVADALREIVAQPGEARRRAARAHERLRTHFTSDAVVPALEILYRRLVGAPARSR